MTRQSPKRRPASDGQDAPKPQQEPQFATEEDIKRLAEAAKFWGNPEVKRLLAERERERQSGKQQHGN